MITVNLGRVQGDSAYQSYVKTTTDRPVKTELEWLASLRGPQGIQGPKGDPGSGSGEGVQGPKGEKGDPGDSAYQSYVKTTTDNPVKTEVEWLASLKAENPQGGSTSIEIVRW